MVVRALLVALLIVPVASSVTWTDPAWDQKVEYVVEAQPVRVAHDLSGEQNGYYPEYDLLAAGLEETTTSLRFWVEVTDPTGDAPSTDDQTALLSKYYFRAYVLEYTLKGERQFIGLSLDSFRHTNRLHIGRPPSAPGQPPTYADQSWEATMLPSARGWVGEVPKSAIIGPDMAPLRAGQVLKDILIRADPDSLVGPAQGRPCPTDVSLERGRECGWQVEDTMLDLGDFEITMDPPDSRRLGVSFEVPMRASNGLATTYVYEGRIHNHDSLLHDVAFQVTGVPRGWEAFFPGSTKVPAGESRPFQVALRVPFAHAHGAQNVLQLVAASIGDPDVAVQAPFGVRYSDPPQPSAHHSVLHPHLGTGPGGSYTFPYLDTRFGAPNGRQPTYAPNAIGPGNHRFDVPMFPQLGIGLEASGDPGHLRITLDPANPGDHRVRAEMRLSDGLVLLAGETIIPGPEPVLLDMPLAWVADKTRVPYVPDRNLFLRITVTSTNGFTGSLFGGPALLFDDANIELPLLEYHDEVPAFKQPDFAVEAPRGTVLRLNPAGQGALTFNVTNHLPQDYRVAWKVHGGDAPWATVTPETTSLPAGGAGQVVVRVKASADVRPGYMSDFLLVGKTSKASDPPVLIGFRVVITGDAMPAEDDIEDLEAAARRAEEARRDAPGFALGAVAAALLVALRRRPQR